MIRLQDIADRAGVSRTTVSNVLHGNTKRVSLKTIEKITALLEETNYVPNMASSMLSGERSRIIGVVLGYAQTHDRNAMQDPFVGELVGTIQHIAECKGFYVMLIGGEDHENVVDIASRWDVDGLIILGFSEERYQKMRRKLNKKSILIDFYPENETDLYSVSSDDFDGGYQAGRFLMDRGFDKACFVAETILDIDRKRWLGFKTAMEENGAFCPKSRYIHVSQKKEFRLRQLTEMIPMFLKAGAIFLPSDYAAIEAMNLFLDHGLRIPEDISVIGFDDSVYAEFVRPKLTTVRQDVPEKARIALNTLLNLIDGVEPEQKNIQLPVRLMVRGTVGSRKNINGV